MPLGRPPGTMPPHMSAQLGPYQPQPGPMPLPLGMYPRPQHGAGPLPPLPMLDQVLSAAILASKRRLLMLQLPVLHHRWQGEMPCQPIH